MTTRRAQRKRAGRVRAAGEDVRILAVPIHKPEAANLILGQAHFVKTVEDVHEALVCAVPNIAFGLAFSEASGDCLVRWSGTDAQLTRLAREAVLALGAGHSFLVLLGNCYPINVLPALRHVPEVCAIHCATANPVEVIVAETARGRGVLGVVDGERPRGIEGEAEIAARKGLLRKFGYKL